MKTIVVYVTTHWLTGSWGTCSLACHCERDAAEVRCHQPHRTDPVRTKGGLTVVPDASSPHQPRGHRPAHHPRATRGRGTRRGPPACIRLVRRVQPVPPSAAPHWACTYRATERPPSHE